ncbi:hypothetical protein [Pseudomonas putida]|uniref:hypothetical protein n=1 Tax=Pseudomonas putida TaxID=303 RepID=UPI002DBD44A0|nr:hypothetical protein [Pseudomonas putida]WRW03810.1 hypothetical protein VPZ82_29900 [Pseudomonas putida]
MAYKLPTIALHLTRTVKGESTREIEEIIIAIQNGTASAVTPVQFIAAGTNTAPPSLTQKNLGIRQ